MVSTSHFSQPALARIDGVFLDQFRVLPHLKDTQQAMDSNTVFGMLGFRYLGYLGDKGIGEEPRDETGSDRDGEP
jgi:hypothetical protein